MTDETEIIDLEEVEVVEDVNRYKHSLFLVVADESDGFNIALRHAAQAAKASDGHIGILFVMNIKDFQHWGGVENIMREEQRSHAEKFLRSVAKKVNDLNGLFPSFYVREGTKVEEIIKLIEEDNRVQSIVLAAGSGKSGQDKLISYFLDKGLSNLTVPMVIVPEHLDTDQIDSITSTYKSA